MRFALSPGHQLGEFYIGQNLHSALKQLKEASNGRGSPLWKQVDVLSPKDPLRPVMVVGLLEDGSKWTITFDGVHHIALTASITLDAPVEGSTGRMLELQENEGSFPRHHTSPRLLQTWVTSRGRPESLNRRCSANGLVVLEACTVEQASTSGTGFVSKVLCEGVLLTLSHDTTPSSNVVVPPPFVPTSLQDLLPMDCHIIGIELLPQGTSPLLPLLHGIRKTNKKGVTLTRPLQTIPFVYMLLGGSDERVVGICVNQECPPAAAPFSTNEYRNPHYHGQRKVLFGDTMQSVLTELGAPESCYYRTLDNAEMFLPLPEGLSRLDQRMSCHRTDVFFNYFRLGMDIVFDAGSMGVKKFVLHASPPEAVEFESYGRCHFRLACSQGQLATGNEAQIVFSPSHTWSQVASHLGTACRLQKVVQHRELEFLGHPCTTRSWYSALGQCMVEVLENDVISCICILPDVVDVCTLPLVPSEDVSLPMQSPTGLEYEEEACPSIPSSLPSTGDEFEDARSSFQTPSSSLGLTSSYKMDCPLPLFPNVNVVLCEAQRNADQPMHSNLEGERELPKSADAIVVVPCFTDAEESEESDDEEQVSSANEEDGEVVYAIDRECSSSEWNIQPEAAHESSSQKEDAEASLTSNFDVISSLRSDTEVAAEEATPPNSSPGEDGESVKGGQIVAEPKIVLYKPEGSTGKASRLQDIIDSSQSSSGRKSETKGDRAIVAGRVGRPAGEVVKKGSGKRSKFAVSEREEKLLQRLCKPTATSLIRQTKASPMVPQSSEEKQQQDELWRVGPDLSTSNLMDVTEEEEKACDVVEDTSAPETDPFSVLQTGGVGGHIDANMEEYDEDAVDVVPLDLLAIPFLQQHAQVNQFRSNTFDRLFPTEQPPEDPKPTRTAASTAEQEPGVNNPPSSLATPDLSLGSFQDALLKQFDVIKDCNTPGSDLSTVNNGGHSHLYTGNGDSHGDRSTTNGGSHGDQSATNDGSHGDQSATNEGSRGDQFAANGNSQNKLSTVDSSGATTQSEEMACNRVVSEGVASPGGSQQEKTSAEPLLPFSDSPEQTHGSTSSVMDTDSTVTLPGCHIPDDVGDSIRDDDAQTNSRSHEDEVALDTLHKGRWMDAPICTVPGALHQDEVEPLMSLNSSFIEDLTTDAVDMAARLHHRSKVLPEYLSSLLTSPWKGGLPSPCQLEGEEEQVLFVSALEVLLENKEEFLTLERCLSLLPRLNTLLSEVALVKGKDHSCSVVCAVIETAAVANMAVLDQYKAGLLKTSSKDHYMCQLCYSRFEGMAGTLAALHEELSLPSGTSVEGSNSGSLVAVDTAKTAVDKILRQVMTHSEKKAEIEALTD